MSDFQGKVNFIWSVADEILRDDFKRSKYRAAIVCQMPAFFLASWVLHAGSIVMTDAVKHQ